MVFVAQVIRASVCGSEGRGFEPHQTHKTSERCLLIFRSVERYGRVAEWIIAQLLKSCIRDECIVGSNPTSSSKNMFIKNYSRLLFLLKLERKFIKTNTKLNYNKSRKVTQVGEGASLLTR